MNNSISFIMPCFNCADTIDESIFSIINTNLEPGDEIILINDASADNTYSKLMSYAAKYDYVKVLKHNINKGTAAAGRNTGIDAAKNELLFCLDADNILLPHSIKPLKDFLVARSLDVAAFGRIDYFEKDISNITNSWHLVEKPDFIGALNDPTKTACGSGNFLLTKSVWKKVGRYNEFLGGAYDSELFGLKLLAEGAKFQTLQGTSYLHRQGYESTFFKDYRKKNTSLLFLSGLINYIHLINDNDVDYMFNKGRLTWQENISKRPIKGKKNTAGKSYWSLKGRK